MLKKIASFISAHRDKAIIIGIICGAIVVVVLAIVVVELLPLSPIG